MCSCYIPSFHNLITLHRQLISQNDNSAKCPCELWICYLQSKSMVWGLRLIFHSSPFGSFPAYLFQDKLGRVLAVLLGNRVLSPGSGTAALGSHGVLMVLSQLLAVHLRTLVVQLRPCGDQAGPMLTGDLVGPLVVQLGVHPVVLQHLGGSSLHWRSTELFREYSYFD